MPLGGSCERGKVPAPWEAPSKPFQLGQKGSLRSSEESTAAGWQQAEHRENDTEGLCYQAALPSPRGVQQGVYGEEAQAHHRGEAPLLRGM